MPRRPVPRLTELPDLDSLAEWDARLRQVPRHPEQVARAAELAKAALAGAGAREQCRLYGYIGNAARLLGQDGPATAALSRSLELARELGDSRLEATAAIRLAEAHRAFDRLDAAESLLRAVLESGERRDFALQHLGKVLLDAGRADEAVPLLEEALELRRAGDDAALVASTEQALERARS